MRLSLIIPCFNESKNLPSLLKRCKTLTAEPGVEVILVDNGSTDDTKDVLSRLLTLTPGCRSVCVDVNRGYGYGIIEGLKAANGEILAWTHADMQTDPVDALRGLRIYEAEKNKGLFIKGRRRARPFFDVVFTIGMSIFETILLRRRLWDINAQPTMFHRSFFNTWENPPDDFSLDLYAYFLAREADLEVRRFTVSFENREHGTSHWNVSWASKKKFILRTIDFSVKLKNAIKK
jgi:glycosyltransferase involved in cell wall biosynthesis